MKNRVHALELRHTYQLEAQSSDHQLMLEQLQVLSDEQRELREQLPHIQQQRKQNTKSKTSKAINQSSSCSSDEHEQANGVISVSK